MFKTWSASSFFKRILSREYVRRQWEANPDKMREYARKAMAKQRTANPEHYKKTNRIYQQTWRIKNPDLNRYKAKHGIRGRQIYNQLLELMKG